MEMCPQNAQFTSDFAKNLSISSIFDHMDFWILTSSPLPAEPRVDNQRKINKNVAFQINPLN